jgi:prevent-host-death family protein
MPIETTTISATEFKAKCLDLLDRVGRGELTRLVVTKRGSPVAVVIAPSPEATEIEHLHGFMRGSVIIPPGVDLTEPISDEMWSAAQGKIHC